MTYDFLSKEIEPIDFLEGTISHVLITEGDKGLTPERIALS